MKERLTLGRWLATVTELIPTDNVFYGSIPDFLKQTINSQLLKQTLMGMYYNYPIRSVYIEDENLIYNAICGYLGANNYRYQTLYDTMNFDYNPIENYRMVEEGSGNSTNNINGTDTYGAYTENNTQDATTDTTNHGAHTDQVNQTMNHGAHTDTTTRNSYTDVSTRKVAPEDSTTFYNAEQTDNQHGNQQDTVQAGASSDSNDTSNIYASYSDNVNVGQRHNTVSRDEYSNSAEQKTLNSYNNTLTRSGNIGVTTSQQMILSEREVAGFNIYEIIATDLMRLLCNRVNFPIIHKYPKLWKCYNEKEGII